MGIIVGIAVVAASAMLMSLFGAHQPWVLVAVGTLVLGGALVPLLSARHGFHRGANMGLVGYLFIVALAAVYVIPSALKDECAQARPVLNEQLATFSRLQDAYFERSGRYAETLEQLDWSPAAAIMIERSHAADNTTTFTFTHRTCADGSDDTPAVPAQVWVMPPLAAAPNQ